MVNPSLPSHLVIQFRFQLSFFTGKQSSKSHGEEIQICLFQLITDPPPIRMGARFTCGTPPPSTPLRLENVQKKAEFFLERHSLVTTPDYNIIHCTLPLHCYSTVIWRSARVQQWWLFSNTFERFCGLHQGDVQQQYTLIGRSFYPGCQKSKIVLRANLFCNQQKDVLCLIL